MCCPFEDLLSFQFSIMRSFHYRNLREHSKKNIFVYVEYMVVKISIEKVMAATL